MAEMELNRLTAKKERLFTKMTELYKKSVNVSDFASRSNEEFLVSSELLEEMRREFEGIVDEWVRVRLQLEPNYKIDYQCVSAFEDMVCRVKRVRNRIISNCQSLKSDPMITKIKLPSIELPQFDGKMENWPRFYESFRANVHENINLNDSQRVQYLVSRLSTGVLKIAAGIVPSGETYKIVWEGLVKKYQDSRKLGVYYLNNILKAEPCVGTADSLDRFVENFSASILALRQLNFEDLSDFIFLHCALGKMDAQTIQAFESTVRGEKLPSCAMLISFVRDQVKVLERSATNNSHIRRPYGKKVNSDQIGNKVHKSFLASNLNAPLKNNCVYCKKNGHLITDCIKFITLNSPRERFRFVNRHQGCVSCLELSHTVKTCNRNIRCEKCNFKHNSLLHFLPTVEGQAATSGDVTSIRTRANLQSTAGLPANEALPSLNKKNNSMRSVSAVNEAVSLSARAAPGAQILLATIQAYAKRGGNPKNNGRLLIRCLLDNGSQNNLITSACCRDLGLKIVPVENSHIRGVGLQTRPVLGYVHLELQSRIYKDKRYNIRALVVECITDRLPSCCVPLNTDDLIKLQKLPLADLSWNVPGDIHLILGAQLFPYIYLGDRINSGRNAPLALSTTFGYVLMGDCPVSVPRLSESTEVNVSFSATAICDMMQKFWELEELPAIRRLSPEDTECENLYVTSVARMEDGRYSVALPFSRDPKELGNSRAAALRRFGMLERKFSQCRELRDNYFDVIREYLQRGYLAEVSTSELGDDGYYIPHHGVMRSDKPKPRIVLDASSKTQKGYSLNDILHAGPNLQADLFLLLVNFRLFPIAMTADVKQMYMQILVPEEHRKYLRIVFRFATDEEVRTFQFERLPFGLKSSPYLAMRTVRQLAEDMRAQFPAAARVAESSLFMDDLVYSVNDEVTASSLALELISLFKSGAFDLVKWASNSETLLRGLPDSHRSILKFGDEDSNVSKVLGLSWQPTDDQFFFTTIPVEERCTKRTILSMVARLFDVLGLVAPVILYAKLLIKELWLCKIDWDEEPPEEVRVKFSLLRQEFPLISNIRIPRHSGVFNNCTVSIVAFCDASLKGYGCVIYVHTSDTVGNTTVRLLCAKSKVAPAKITTLARLELCAALMMAMLIKTIRDAYCSRLPIDGTYAFSDSTIALSWIHSSPHRWSVFVGNRVAQCQEHVDVKDFYHIDGKTNPSDCLSRGMLPSQVLVHELWWSGPSWLKGPVSEWPIRPFASSSGIIPEQRATVLTAVVCQEDSIVNLLSERISSWDKLLRVFMYVLRFIRKIGPGTSIVRSLSVAERYVVSSIQRDCFAEDIVLLKKGEIPTKRLRKLSLFIDEDGVVRVGGRLKNSDLPFEARHPILLPKHHPLVVLIINHYHRMNCHTGSGLLMSILRQRYWILDARTVVRAVVRKCNTCFRVRPSHPTPKMADLPSCRVIEAKAFVHTGVDYAGPIKITLTRRRGQHSQKAYICLFICLVTKAVHVELVSDLTANSFLAAFSRFISRRGPVSCLYSDNGTNFIGAKAQLDELYAFLLRSSFRGSLEAELAKRRIEWKMIPPRAPHFGGIWESNIKSLKSHLYRVIGTQILTYEELQTVLVQIECIMNSRPLNVVSSDPDPEVITPAHFLMSSPLQCLPAAEMSDAGMKIRLSDRKQLLDSMVQSFWKKWRLEYLHTLQVRHKWSAPDHPVTVGTVVLVGQDDAPPLCWPLGVVSEVHPGSDGTVRVATVKTKFGSFKRPVVKLYPIPSQ